MVLLKEAQYVLLELAGALAGNDLNEGRLLGDGLVEDALQGLLDRIALVVDVMQVQRELHGSRLRSVEQGDHLVRGPGGVAVDKHRPHALARLRLLNRLHLALKQLLRKEMTGSHRQAAGEFIMADL